MNEESIFAEALGKKDQERAAFLNEQCKEDVGLRKQVEALLRAHDYPDPFLEAPGLVQVATIDEPSVTERPGTVIGAYKLLERIGEGGFGVVFMAEQTQPVKRKVALKILKPGMDTRQVIARFEAERQALAIMDHPNIAKVLDGGATPSGRPYFVMQLVKGVPITDFCDQNHLSPQQRLELFVPVCQAVQHAHQKGIIHRDLKPTNVIVTVHDTTPVPKIIDFGVAKALGQELTDKTLFTGFTQMIGTPLYMSPEQAGQSGLDIDTRSDIYSLGVLLYELLTGTTPFTKARFKQATYDDIRRIIREEEPPKPSTRLLELGRCSERSRTNAAGPARLVGPTSSLTSVSAMRQIEPAKLTKLVRGELDWVVMKALEKDRTRRYETANALASDVRKYLADEPVQACPPSAVYRFRKFARRNKSALAMAVVIASALVMAVVGLAVSNWLVARERDQKAQALSDREKYLASADEARAEAMEKAEKEARARQEVQEAKGRSDAEALRARRQLYIAHMNLAQTAWEGDQVARVLELLEQHRPTATGEDLRDFEWFYWQRLSDWALRTLKGHSGMVASVAFSPDGKRLASASADKTVKVWETATGHETLTLKGHTDLVASVAFSPDGKRLASASADKTVKVWETATGHETLTLKGHTNWVESVTFSPDGNRLVSASRDGTVRVWDAATGHEILNFKGHTDRVKGVAYSADGKRLASVSSDVKVWNAITGQEVMTLKGHMAVAFSPDGKRLASASADNSVKVWETATGQETLTLKGHTNVVSSVAFSPDGNRLVSASHDGTVKMWNVTTGQETMTLKGHADACLSVVFSPDGKRLASSSNDYTVKVWDAASGQDALSLQGIQGIAVAFDPYGKRIAAIANDWTVRVWDAASGLEAILLKADMRHDTGVAFSPDGKRLVSVAFDGTMQVWEVASGQKTLNFRGHTDRVTSVAFSPDGKRLASASSDRTVKVWEAATGRETLTLKGHVAEVTSVVFSGDSKRLASASDDRTVKVWDVETGQEMMTLKGHSHWVKSVAFSPDGKRLASASSDRTVKVWEAATGQETLTLRGHSHEVMCVAFSPDGKRLASASNTTVKVWDTASGEETLTLKGPARVLSVAFSPDGKRLVSASQNRTVKLWDARPWSPELRIEQEARNLINSLRERLGLRADVIDRIKQDTSLRAEVRQQALDMTRGWTDDPVWLIYKSWRVASRPDSAPGSYAQAFRQAEAACRLEPVNGWYLTTLGVAQYRLGRYQDALASLTRSDRINNPIYGRRLALAFLAMAHHKLGQKERAQSLLTQLRQLMKQPNWTHSSEAKGILEEAEALIQQNKEPKQR
jgi:WD40 repeat protein/serine/threonine protein kinase